MTKIPLSNIDKIVISLALLGIILVTANALLNPDVRSFETLSEEQWLVLEQANSLRGADIDECVAELGATDFVLAVCVRNAALATRDPTECRTGNSFLDQLCFAELSLAQNPDYCSEVTGELREFCLLAESSPLKPNP